MLNKSAWLFELMMINLNQNKYCCLAPPRPSSSHMYNGIGLKTPRGSGTNGYVTRNLSFVKPVAPGIHGSNRKDIIERPTKPKRPSREVLLHHERRRVELELLQLREQLEVKAQLSLQEIDNEMAKERQARYAAIDAMLDRDLKVEKEREMERLQDAFGITADYREGDAFRFPTTHHHHSPIQQHPDEQQKRIKQ